MEIKKTIYFMFAIFFIGGAFSLSSALAQTSPLPPSSISKGATVTPPPVQPSPNQRSAMPPSVQPSPNQRSAMPPSVQPSPNQRSAMPPSVQPSPNQGSAMPPSVQPASNQGSAVPPSVQPNSSGAKSTGMQKTPSVVGAPSSPKKAGTKNIQNKKKEAPKKKEMGWVSDFRLPVLAMVTSKPFTHYIDKKSTLHGVVSLVTSQVVQMSYSPILKEKDPKTKKVHYVMFFFATAPFTVQFVKDLKKTLPRIFKGGAIGASAPNLLKVTFQNANTTIKASKRGLNFLLDIKTKPKAKAKKRILKRRKASYLSRRFLSLKGRRPIALASETLTNISRLKINFGGRVRYKMVRNHRDQFRDTVRLKFFKDFYVRNMKNAIFDGRILGIVEKKRELNVMIPRNMKIYDDKKAFGLVLTLEGRKREDLIIKKKGQYDKEHLKSIRQRLSSFLSAYQKAPFVDSNTEIEEYRKEESKVLLSGTEKAVNKSGGVQGEPGEDVQGEPGEDVQGELDNSSTEMSSSNVSSVTTSQQGEMPAAQLKVASDLKGKGDIGGKNELSRFKKGGRPIFITKDTKIEEKFFKAYSLSLDLVGVLSFNVPGAPSRIALFQQGGVYWLIFPGVSNQKLSDIVKEPNDVVRMIRSYKTRDYTAYEIYVPEGYSPSVTRFGEEWSLTFRQGQKPAVKETLVVEEQVSGGVRYMVSPIGGGNQIRFTNPWTGQQSVVITSSAVGYGNARLRAYTKFRLEESIVGFLISPLADGISVSLGKSSIFLSIPASKNSMTPAQRGEALDKEGADGFNFSLASIPMRSLYDKANDIFAIAAKSKGVQANIELTNLARLYFSHGFFAETLGAVGLMEKDKDSYVKSKEVKLMKGVSNLYLGRYKEAGKYLEDEAVKETGAGYLWRSLLYGAQMDYQKAARILSRLNLAMGTYPPTLRGDIIYRLGIIYTALASLGRTQQMYSLLDTFLSEYPDPQLRIKATYLHARLLQLLGKFSLAQQSYEKVILSRDPELEVKARFDLIMMLYPNGFIRAEDAVDQLEQLDFLWRGGEWNSKFIQQKVSLYMSLGRHREALENLRYLLSTYPEGKDMEQIAISLTQIFESLFISEESDKLSPLEAISLYREFSELVPAGPRGERLIERLVDYLVEANLLTQAESVLSDQIQFRLKDEDAARAGSRLAFVYLMHKKPAPAISILNKTSMPNLQPSLKRQRLFLKIQSLLFLNNYKEARRLLGVDTSEEANLLQVDIAVKEEDWAKVVYYYQRILNQEGIRPSRTLTPLQAQYLINMVAALVLMRNKAALQRIRDDFQSAVSVTPYRAVFDLLTLRMNRSDLTVDQLNEVMKMLDSFQNFMHHYENEVRESRLSFFN